MKTGTFWALIPGLLLAGMAQAGITETPRGAVAETNRYKIVITDGIVTGFLNKLTGEEYINKDANRDHILPFLPSGLGTQASEDDRLGAYKLFLKPWWEYVVDPNFPNAWNTPDPKLGHDANWPNQHYPHVGSKFAFAAKGDSAAVLTYTGLFNGQQANDDEVYSLELAIDANTADLLVTPAVKSPRPGVYGCSLTVSGLAPAITIEAPIFEGVRLDRSMQPKMWVNQWGSFWDYSFLALNGEKAGAIAVWGQDADLNTYKYLFWMSNSEGLSFSVMSLNMPPFDKSTEARPLTWRLQAFDKSWAQAAARFRDWRVKNQKFAKRPDWVGRVCFMNYGIDKAKSQWIDYLTAYFDDKDLGRTVTFAPAIREVGFDKNHTNNTPYQTFESNDPKKPSTPGFREDMKAWKAKNVKLMAYLQPTIMWSPAPKNDREQKGLEYALDARTRCPFLPDANTSVTFHDYHNLAHPQWQRWFLDWVKEYIQDYGADGIYHDSAYICPMDVRGAAIGGKTSAAGMAEYFYKAQTENPNSIHGTEHMTEVNTSGASLGLGCGTIWGTKPSMNMQRIKQASPVSNALHAPYGAIFGFPHKSQIVEQGGAAFHLAMEQMERRGDLPATPLMRPLYAGKSVPFDQFVNELWLERARALLFVRNGLRATFPEDWDRKVLTYFRGDKGEDFRYEQTPWGTAFVQYEGGKRLFHYGRIYNVAKADPPGGIAGWPCYDASGPTGLNPRQCYVIDPNVARPAAWLEIPDGVCVADGFANDVLMFARLAAADANMGASGPGLSVFLHSAQEPKGVWIDGKAAQAGKATDGRWEIKAPRGSAILVLNKAPAEGKVYSLETVVNRIVDPATGRDYYNPAFLSVDVKETNGVLSMMGKITTPYGAREVHIPLRAPKDGGDGTMTVAVRTYGTAVRYQVNGAPAQTPTATTRPVALTFAVPLKAGECSLLTFLGCGPGDNYQIQWQAAGGENK